MTEPVRGCPVCGSRTGLHGFSFDVKVTEPVPDTTEFDADCEEFGCLSNHPEG
jgi:hypothetical protein